MKRILSILLATAMLLSLAACGSSGESDETEASSGADYAGQTLYGKVTAISGSSVTVQLGSVSEMELSADGMGGDMQMPDGEGGGNMEMPDGESGEAPEMPDGESGDAPEMPDGEGGSMEMPDGEGGAASMMSFTASEDSATFHLEEAQVLTSDGSEGSVSDIAVGDYLMLVVGDDNTVTSATLLSGVMEGSADGMGDMQTPGSEGGGFNGDSATVTQGTAATTLDADGDYEGETYTSTGDDENALRVDGATVTLTGITVDKSAGSSSDVESGDFYGMNAALLATNGAQVTISGATITSSAQNGNGVFSYGTGTVVTISDSTITTTADNSGGIQTTGGGTTNAYNLTVETSGSSAAAIRSDRGGGTVNVDGGTYTTNGYNSPAVYSTATITVANALLTATNSEALVIEGQNSITLVDCDVSGNMSDTQGSSSSINVHNVMIYQSMSGDADVGTSSFSMTGGSLTAQNGDMFYITNTSAVVTLSDVTIVNEDADGKLMVIAGNNASNGWGTAGANGAQVTLTADAQVLEGDITVDTISTLDMTLTNGSSFTGTVNIVENAEGGAAVENNAVITIDEGCTWTLTGDCTITSLTNNGTINFNGYTITLADGWVLCCAGPDDGIQRFLYKKVL